MDFNLITIIALAAALLIGGFIGVGLGRRSTTANAYYDKIRAEADSLRARLNEAEAQLRAKAK
jgi:hypothetical protein